MEGASSLFGPNASDIQLQVDDGVDEEELEDERRRKLELEEHLKNALGEFSSDEDEYDSDEDSVDQTCPSMHAPSRSLTESAKIKGPIQDRQKFKVQDLPQTTHHAYFYNSPKKKHSNTSAADQKLQALYEVRVREVQLLGEKLEACQREGDIAREALYGRLAVANADKERAELSLQQSQELLANSRHHITELEAKVSSLSSKVESLQLKNEELTAELAAATASLMDSQNRLQTARMNNNTAQTTDHLFRSQQEKHKEEIERLERELSRAKNTLSKKENELLAFEKRYIDMERLKEDLLVEKGSTINKLAMELEDAQNRLINNNHTKYSEKVGQLTSERNTAQAQVKGLAIKLESTAKELVETRRNLSNVKEDKQRLEFTLEHLVVDNRESSSFAELRGFSSGTSPYEDKIDLLQCELTKTLSAQKMKRDQIDKLQQTLNKRDEIIEKQKKEIKFYKQSEIQHMSEIKKLKTEIELVADKTSVKLQNELQNTNSELSFTKSKFIGDGIGKSMENIENNPVLDRQSEHILQFQLCDAKKQIEDLRDMYIDVCSSKDKLMRELDELKSCDVYKSLEEERANVDELIKQLKYEKLKVDDLGNKLLNQQLEEFQKQLNTLKKVNNESREGINNEKYNRDIKQLEAENSKLKELCQEQSDNLTRLVKDLEESKNLITQLNAEIELQGQREILLADLKEKAKQFERFLLDKKNSIENVKHVSTSTKPYDQQYSSMVNNGKNEVSLIEKQIRQDVGQHFAMELKEMEAQYNKKIIDINRNFENNLTELAHLLKIKTKEVETLQEVISSERQKCAEMKFNSNNISPDDESIHIKCKKNLNEYKSVIDSLSKEIDKMKEETVPVSNIREMENKFSENLQDLEKLKAKYKIIKKTASKYKEYIKEKDAHVTNELDRIKSTYEISLRKMQERLQNYVARKENQAQNVSPHNKPSSSGTNYSPFNVDPSS